MESKKSCLLSEENRVSSGVERKPSSEFYGLIKRFWFSDKGEKEERLFEILPDGNFDLVFILNDSSCKLLFAGPYTRKAAIPILPGREYFGVTFRPGRVPRLADLHPTELIDTTVELPKLLGMNTDLLGECLLSADGIDAKQAFMERVFQKAGIKSLVRRDLCNRCAELIESCDRQIKVNDLACHVGTSIRTLERTFLKDMGISPKMFIRLVRFHDIVKKLRKGGYPTLTYIAYEFGYTDQSHFIKDFKALAGRLPSEI